MEIATVLYLCMAKTESIQNNNQNKGLMIAIGIVFVLAITNFLSYRVGKQAGFEEFLVIPHTTRPTSSSSPVLTPQIVTPSPSPKVFSSKKLGISFMYIADLGGQHVSTREIGNKAYIYVDRTGSVQEVSDEKYVEVLSKNSGEGLEQVLQRTLKQDNLTQVCKVVITQPASLGRNYVNMSNYTIGSIGPIEINSDEEYQTIMSKKQKCEPRFNGGAGYYLADSKHPNKYLYFSIGQDTFMSGVANKDGDEASWDETIQFLD